MSTGKRLRFEILKRDGFRCRYCGVTSLDSMLHVDHVIPRSEGGTDDPENLVTSCQDCNLGKSNVGLEDTSATTSGPTTEDALEHAEQVREYLAAQMEVENARNLVRERLADIWRECVGGDPLRTWYSGLRSSLRTHTFEQHVQAIEAVGLVAFRLRDGVARLQYFRGCLRRMRSGASVSDLEQQVEKLTDSLARLERLEAEASRWASFYCSVAKYASLGGKVDSCLWHDHGKIREDDAPDEVLQHAEEHIKQAILLSKQEESRLTVLLAETAKHFQGIRAADLFNAPAPPSEVEARRITTVRPPETRLDDCSGTQAAACQCDEAA